MSDNPELATVWKLHRATLRLQQTATPWKLWLLWRDAGGPRNPGRDYRSHCEKHLAAAAEALGFALVPIEPPTEPHRTTPPPKAARAPRSDNGRRRSFAAPSGASGEAAPGVKTQS